MSRRDDIDLLVDIKGAIYRIDEYIAHLNYEKFQQDIKTQDAVIRNLEIIGEAAKNISSEVKKKFPQMPWKKLAGVRDRLIHHYFGINLDIVWNIIKEELPDLISELNNISKKRKLT